MRLRTRFRELLARWPRQSDLDPARRPPPFLDAVAEDSRRALEAQLKHDKTLTRAQLLRMTPKLMVTTDGQLGLVAFRAQSTLADLRLRLPAAAARRLCHLAGGFTISDDAVLAPGVLVPHGQVVIGGRTSIGAGSSIRPWCRLSPAPGSTEGPTLGGRVMVGTGAHVIGAVKVGTWAVIGAHAVVTEDVPARATVVGNPARIVAVGQPRGRAGPNRGTRG